MYSYLLRSFKHFFFNTVPPPAPPPGPYRNLKEDNKEMEMEVIFYSISRGNNV